MNTIAERLLFLRGTTKQGDFAKALGVNPNTLRSYENGRSSPNQEFLERVCVQFSVSAEWLLLGRGPMHPNDTAPAPQLQAPQPETAPETGTCARCARLEAELEREKEERRELSAENRRLGEELREVNAVTRRIMDENADLRVQLASLNALDVPQKRRSKLHKIPPASDVLQCGVPNQLHDK